MENKQPKRRWKIPVLLVSAICILLASSFVFSIGVEALTYDYSLQTFYPQNPVDREGSDYATVDTSVITDMSVTENNDFSTGSANGSVYHYSPFSGLGYTAFGFENFLYCYGSGGTYYVVTADQTYQYSSQGVFYPFGYSYSGNLYDLEGNLLYTVGSYGIQCCAYYNSFYYVFYITGSSSSRWFNVAIVNENFVLVETLQERGDWNSKFQMLLLDGAFAFFKDSNIVFFDFDDRAFSSVDLSSISYPPEGEFVASYDGDSVYMFSTNASYQSVKYTLSSGALSNFPAVTAFVASSDVYFCSYYSGSFICNTRTQIVTLNYQDYFYDFGSYVDSNSYTPDRYLNFESHYTSSLLSGGYHVGIELDFGVSPLMFSQVNLKGFEISVTTLIASDYMISSETTITAPRPLNCWNGTNYITDYRTSYNYIGQRDGKYLYMCTSSCDFATQGKLNPIKVVINCYLPYQVASHNYSIPVSFLSFTDEYSGGGGESSDASSGGGGASFDTSSGGDVSVPDDGLNHIFLVSYDENGNAYYEYVDSIDLASASSVRLYLGAYTSYGSPMQSDVPVKCNLLVSYGNSPPDEYRYDFHAYGYMIGNSFQSPSVVGAYQFPAFVGYYVDVSVGAGEDLYLSEVSPWGTLFVAQNSFSFGRCLTAQLPDPNAYIHLEFTSSDSVSVIVMSNSPAQRKSFPVVYDGYSLGFRENDGYFHYYPHPAEVGESLDFTVDWFVDDGQSLFACILGDYDDLKPSPLPSWSDDLSKYYDDLAEVSRKWEIMESIANENYGKYPFENDQVIGGFDDAVSLFDDIVDASGGEYLVDYLKGMWTVHPYFPLMIGMVVTFAIIGFIIAKL